MLRADRSAVIMVAPETWTLCVAVLTAVGYKEPIARGLIGRQLREWDECDVVKAYEKASGKADPRAYAAGILEKTKRKARKIQDQLPLIPEAPKASPETIRAALQRSKEILRGRS